jgi:hypothetical protein
MRCYGFYSTAAVSAAPHPRIILAREADWPDAFAAPITNLCDIAAMLFEQCVRLLRRQFHFMALHQATDRLF